MISLIATVKNEENNIKQWLESLFSQDQQPDECIIVDGGSTDGTFEILSQFQHTKSHLKVMQKYGNISQGRNMAIMESRGDIIVVTDAGCMYDHSWFRELVKPLQEKKTRFATTAFGPLLTSNDTLITFMIAAATIPRPAEFLNDWVPSSRSIAFEKILWKYVGGYPEWLPICEDVVFNKAIEKKGFSFYFIRKPLVQWRPRTSMLSYLYQLFRYTKSEGHAYLNTRRQFIRYVVYAIFLMYFIKEWYILTYITIPVIMLACMYLFRFWVRFLVFCRDGSFFLKIAGFLLLPAVVGIGDMAKMAGWPIGAYKRFKNNFLRDCGRTSL